MTGVGRAKDKGAVMDGAQSPGSYYLFEFCRLDTVSRTLTRRGVRVPLPARLFDILLLLVENNGRLVLRQELLETVWSERTVDDGNLQRAISSLRAALKEAGLDETCIVTVPRRGYRFGMPVTIEPRESHREKPWPDTPAAVPAEPPPRVLHLPNTAIAGMAAAAVLLTLMLWRLTAQSPPAGVATQAAFSPPPRSIAVLPFRNAGQEAGSDPSLDYLADGIPEELIDALGRIDSLHVAARMSAFSFKGQPATIQTIARALDVGVVLEGSVQRRGGRLRLTAQLNDGRTGFQIWSRTYDRDPHDVLTAEGEIAAEIVTSLTGDLRGDQLARLGQGGTPNARAFDAYLTGMAQMGLANEDAYRRAAAAFTDAATLDPNYAEAFVQRAMARTYGALTDSSPDPAAAGRLLDLALHDAEHAVALAPALGQAHATLGYVLKSRLSDLPRAGHEYDQAVALAPNDAATLMMYGFFKLEIWGDAASAVAAARHAAELDPLRPMSYRFLAEALSYAGRFSEAMEALEHARHLQPADPDQDRIYLAQVQIAEGDAAAAEQTCRGHEHYRDLTCLAWADHVLGQQPAAEAALSRLQAALGDNGAYLYAGICASWGRQAAALRWLQKAYELHDPGLVSIRINPWLMPLHGTSEYKDLIAKLGLPA